MQLTGTGQAATDSFEDISFLMQDGEKVVRIDVQRRLLKDLAGLRTPHLEALEEHRTCIERIASTKYEARDYVKSANCCIVTINKDDWVRNFPSGSAHTADPSSESSWQEETYGPPSPGHHANEAHQQDNTDHTGVRA